MQVCFCFSSEKGFIQRGSPFFCAPRKKNFEKVCVTKKVAYISTMNNKQTPNTMINFHKEMLRKLERRVKFQQHCTDLAIKDFGRYSEQHIRQDDELNRLKELVQERKIFIHSAA